MGHHDDQGTLGDKSRERLITPDMEDEQMGGIQGSTSEATVGEGATAGNMSTDTGPADRAGTDSDLDTTSGDTAGT